MIDFEALLTDEEKEAIAVLESGGFLSLSDVKINDCRDLNSGNRMRTFRNRGKYDLVIACRNLSDRAVSVDETAETDATDDDSSGSTEMLKPIIEMTKAELLSEAKGYDGITGEYKMDKAELAEAVQAQRDRRDLIKRKFEV